jgi:membrane protein DedA with SNARE-associated domain
MREWIEAWGLPAILVGALLEGDATAVLGGAFAHLGLLAAGGVLATVFAGALASDCLWFAAGRLRSERVRATRLWRRLGPRVSRVADRIGPWQLLACRFVWGTRVASILYWSVRGLSPPRFAAFMAAGTALWTAALVGVGYFASNAAEAALGKVARGERRIALVILVVAGSVAALRAVARARAPRAGGER